MKTLYITDLDGTLLNNDGKLSDFTRDTINRLTDSGMNFTVATARSRGSARLVIPGLKTNAPAVLLNGVFLTELDTNKVISCRAFPDGAAKKVIDAFAKEGSAPNLYSYSDGDMDIQIGKDASNYELDFFERRKGIFRSAKVTENYDCSAVVYANKVAPYPILRRIADRIDKIDGISYVLYSDNYSDNYFLESFSEKANKRAGIAELRKMGYERIVAFGDNFNDLEMFSEADISIAVANACDEVKSAADIVIGANCDDAVASFLIKDVEKA